MGSDCISSYHCLSFTLFNINGLCVTATVKVTKLQGFISLQEIKLFRLMRNTNFISVRNPYISLRM